MTDKIILCTTLYYSAVVVTELLWMNGALDTAMVSVLDLWNESFRGIDGLTPHAISERHITKYVNIHTESFIHQFT